MLHGDGFVVAVSISLSLKPIVLDIVHDFHFEDNKKRVNDQKSCSSSSKDSPNKSKICNCCSFSLKELVFQ